MTAPVHIAANGAAQPVFHTTRKETPVIDEKLRNARPRPRAPEGMPVVIAFVFGVGFGMGTAVTALAGWMW